MSKKSGGFLTGALIGGVAAAAAALLFTPKSGKELREDLTDQANDFKNKAIENGEDGKPDYTGQAVEVINSLKDKAIKGSNDALKAIKTQKEEVEELANDLTDELPEEDIIIEIPGEDALEELMDELEEVPTDEGLTDLIEEVTETPSIEKKN